MTDKQGGCIFGCKKYKLVGDVTNVEDIMRILIPIDILNGNSYKMITSIANSINSTIPEEEQKYYIEKITQIIVASSAAVVSGGLGGDMVVNFLFTIKKAIDMAAKTILIINEFVDMVTTKSLNGIEVDKDAITYVSDIFNINLEDGIEGVECWTRQLRKKYDKENTRVFVCDILRKIYPHAVEFIGNLIGTMIPDVGVVAGTTIIYMMKTNMGKNKMIGDIIRQLKKQYKKISKKMRRMIEDPDNMEKFIKENIEYLEKIMNIFVNKQGGGLIKILSKTVGKIARPITGTIAHMTGLDEYINRLSDMTKIISDNAKLIAYIMNKMIALTFAMLYTMKECTI